jgi:predicted nucleic acid-binding protein
MTGTDPERLLDTSVLVRYLTNDLPEVAAEARDLIEGESPVQIHSIILAEAAWVLLRHYGVPRDAVMEALVRLVLRENIRVGSHDRYLVREALLKCTGSGRTSIRDALLWLEARSSEGVVYTCDRRFPSDAIQVRHVGSAAGSQRERPSPND